MMRCAKSLRLKSGLPIPHVPFLRLIFFVSGSNFKAYADLEDAIEQAWPNKKDLNKLAAKVL